MTVRLIGGRLVDDKDNPADITLEADDGSNDAAPSDDIRRCETCGTALNYSGRGRPPRFCEDCKPVSPNRSGGGTSPRRTSSLRNEAALREALAARYVTLAMIANWRNPAYAANIRGKIDRAVQADIDYAKVSPSFRRALESLIEKSAAGEVIAVHAAMLFPIAVGEANRRTGKRPTASPRGEAGSPRPQRESPTPPPQPPTTPHMRLVPDDMPGEHTGPANETVNAASMDGMPGGF